MRNLASVQIINKLEPIAGADRIELATILGWHCVVKKDEFKVGDKCIYFEIDSVLPVKPEYEFLRDSSYNKLYNGFRIKTRKLRGVVSQGLVLPLNEDYEVGTDLTEIIGVEKYEVPDTFVQGDSKGNFPSFIYKTDETRIQSVPEMYENVRYDNTFYAVEKLDGTSSTFYVKDGEFGVCSRNMEKRYSEESVYWKIAKKYDIENKLRSAGYNVAIQGEIIGGGIQKNIYKIPDHKLYLFDAYNIDGGFYFMRVPFVDFCAKHEFEMCPLIYGNMFLDKTTIDDLVELSKGKSILSNSEREGLVIRSYTQRISFKVINPDYLLKHE